MTIENELYQVVDKAKKYDQLLEFQNSLSEVYCSFCGKSQTNVRKIIAERNVYICDGCVDTCNEILKDKMD